LHLYIHICTYSHICVCKHGRMHACTSTYTHVFIYIGLRRFLPCLCGMLASIYIYVYVYIHTYTYICFLMCLCISICTYIYTASRGTPRPAFSPRVNPPYMYMCTYSG